MANTENDYDNVGQGFSVVQSPRLVTATCAYPGVSCRLASTFGPMKQMFKVNRIVEHSGACIVSIRPQADPNKIEQMTAAISILTQNICEQCVKSQTKQRH